MPVARKILTIFGCLIAVMACAQDANEQLDAKSWAERGWKYESAKRYSLALKCFTKAIEADPNHDEAYFSRSSIHAHLGDHQSAVADLTENLRIRPGNYSALFNRGLYRESLKDYDGAIADYSQILTDDTDFSRYGAPKEEALAHALHYRGRVYQWHKNDPKQAVADYTESIRLYASTDMLFYRRAGAHHDLKNFEAADADFRKAYEQMPDYSNVINQWAWQLATCPDEKYRDGRRALELAKKTGSSMHLAAAYAELGQFDDAIKAQVMMIERLSRNPKHKKADLQVQKERLTLLESKQPIRD